METKKLAEFTSGIRYDQLPPEVIWEAKRRIADIVGIGIYASKEVAGTNIAAYVADTSPSGKASIWCSGKKATPAYAVMAQAGSIFHVELDDVHRLSHTHPAASAVPPALSIGEVIGASGKAVIEAVIAGYEVVARVGMAVSPSIFQDRACMPCAVLGPMGTAAAAARIMGFSPDLTTGTIASASFLTPLTPVESYVKGTTIKEYSMGWAGFLGVTAAEMAKRGFVGSDCALETDFGFCRNACDIYDVSRITPGMGEVYEILNSGIKPYAHCRQHHSTIDCIIELREKYGLDKTFAEVEHVRVRTFIPAVRGKNKEFPTISAAKYSIPYACAVSMIFGDAWIEQYTEELLTDRRVMDLAQKVDVEHDLELQKLYDEKWPAIVDVKMKNGETLTARRDLMKGEPEYPLSDEDLHKKFISLAMRVYDKDKAQRIWDMILGMEKLDQISEITAEIQ